MKLDQKININCSICDYCGVCVSICPPQAIVLKEKEIYVISEKCKQCYWCIDVCPLGAIQEDGKINNVMQKKSSSV